MNDVKKYFTGLYEKALYGISMFGANLANKSLLTLIKFKGLDPDADPEKLKADQFSIELNSLFDAPYHHMGRAASKISIPVPFSRKNPRNGYVIKNNYSGKSVMPDYSNSSGSPQVTKNDLTSLLQLIEKLEKTYSTPRPAAIVPPEGAPTAFVTGEWPKETVKVVADSICKAEDERILKELDKKFDDVCDALTDIDEPLEYTIDNPVLKTTKKRVSPKKKLTKKSKKPAKTNRKR